MAYGVDNTGVAVGTADTPEQDPRTGLAATHPCLWNRQGPMDLGTFGGGNGWAVALNPSGTVAGGAETREIDPHTGYPIYRAFSYSGGRMTNLGTLGGRNSIAYSLNGRGDIVGLADTSESYPSGDPIVHAFIWTGSGMQDLGTPKDAVSTANGINAQGQVTGGVFPLRGGGFGYLWEKGRMRDLNDLMPAGFPYRIYEGWCINDAGEIVAYAVKDQRPYFLLLKPESRTPVTPDTSARRRGA